MTESRTVPEHLRDAVAQARVLVGEFVVDVLQAECHPVGAEWHRGVAVEHVVDDLGRAQPPVAEIGLQAFDHGAVALVDNPAAIAEVAGGDAAAVQGKRKETLQQVSDIFGAD